MSQSPNFAESAPVLEFLKFKLKRFYFVIFPTMIRCRLRYYSLLKGNNQTETLSTRVEIEYRIIFSQYPQLRESCFIYLWKPESELQELLVIMSEKSIKLPAKSFIYNA